MLDALAETVERFVEKLRPSQHEVYVARNRVTTIRLATSEVVEAKTIVVDGVGVRLVADGSVGFAATNDRSTASLEGVVERAYRAARAKGRDPGFKSLPEPRKAPPSVGFDKEILDLDLQHAAEMGRVALEAVRGREPGLDVSGSINIVSEECFVKNSLGVEASDVSTFIFSSITVEREEALSTIGQSCSRTLRGFDPARASEEAVTLSRQSAGARPIEPGTYDVILSPYAVTELAEFVLAYGVDLSAVDAGFSYFAGRLGEEVASEKFTLRDEGRNPEGIASKNVDDEGVPTRSTTLIRRGVLQGFLSDSYYAQKLSSSLRALESTGNGFRSGAVPGRDPSQTPRVQPTNLVIEAGDATLEEMVESTRRGILVGRIWYTYPVNPTIGEFSTTNRGSTFLIEGGRIASPILPNSFRINHNIQTLLRSVEMASRERVQSIVWGGASTCIAPYLKVGGVPITYSKT